MEHAPLIRWQWHCGHDQGTGTRSAGNQKMPANKLNSLLHFAESNVFTQVGLAEHSIWFKPTAPILHFQANHRSLALKRNTCSGRACVLTGVGQRLLRNPEECRFKRRWQAL